MLAVKTTDPSASPSRSVIYYPGTSRESHSRVAWSYGVGSHLRVGVGCRDVTADLLCERFVVCEATG